jgi:hypothetical protein
MTVKSRKEIDVPKVPGSGRRKGTPNKASAKREAEIAASGKTPLQFLLARMRDEKADMFERVACAKAAAPYVHPRLQTTVLAVPEDGNKNAEIDGLELARRIALILARADNAVSVNQCNGPVPSNAPLPN